MICKKDAEISEMAKQLLAKDNLLQDANKEVVRKSARVENLELKISDLVEKVGVAEQERESIQQHLVEEEELLESTKRDLDAKLKKAERKISELESKVKFVEKENEKLNQDLLRTENLTPMSQTSEKEIFFKKFLEKKEILLELTKKEVSRKCEEIEKLEKESIEAKEAFEKEMQKSRDDLTWAQNYCFQMSQRIKQLENELSKQDGSSNAEPIEIQTNKVNWKQNSESAKNSQQRKIVKLKIRKQ